MVAVHKCGVLFAVMVLASLAVLPACNKKRPTTDGPPSDDSGSKTGPAPELIPANGNSDATLPSRPRPAPLLGVANAQTRAKTELNLKQIGLAFFNAEAAYGAFPQGIADSTGKVGLSWRVALLPFLERDDLYRQFKLDEPWDSEHNKKLIPQMPKIFAPPGVDTFGYTYYRSFTGPGTVMPPSMLSLPPKQVFLGVRTTSITDGTSNTLLIAEATEPVVWTKPDELPFSPGKPPKLGGGVYSNGFHALLCDGSAIFIPSNIDPRMLSNAIQINDGQPVIWP
jgi:hypothetical protein